jgi:hypothetical protein
MQADKVSVVTIQLSIRCLEILACELVFAMNSSQGPVSNRFENEEENRENG